jgi:hypothetical protein
MHQKKISAASADVHAYMFASETQGLCATMTAIISAKTWSDASSDEHSIW